MLALPLLTTQLLASSRLIPSLPASPLLTSLRNSNKQSIRTATRVRRKMTVSLSDENEGEILVLSDYPVYVNGPNPKELARVAEKTIATFKDICGDQLVSLDRMGSSAIDGIAGTPVCDMVAEVAPWPLSEEIKEKLAEAGYECKGKAPHDEEDEWFWGGEGKPGHLGRVVLHTVPKDSEFVWHMQAFVAYVKAHPDAFRRYNDVKVEGARLMLESSEQDGRLLGYKMKKADVCNEIKEEAIEWWRERNQM